MKLIQKILNIKDPFIRIAMYLTGFILFFSLCYFIIISFEFITSIFSLDYPPVPILMIMIIAFIFYFFAGISWVIKGFKKNK